MILLRFFEMRHKDKTLTAKHKAKLKYFGDAQGPAQGKAHGFPYLPSKITDFIPIIVGWQKLNDAKLIFCNTVPEHLTGRPLCTKHRYPTEQGLSSPY
jgi:hypothetical protein